jgi:hypothetical protein
VKDNVRHFQKAGGGIEIGTVATWTVGIAGPMFLRGSLFALETSDRKAAREQWGLQLPTLSTTPGSTSDRL